MSARRLAASLPRTSGCRRAAARFSYEHKLLKTACVYSVGSGKVEDVPVQGVETSLRGKCGKMRFKREPNEQKKPGRSEQTESNGITRKWISRSTATQVYQGDRRWKTKEESKHKVPEGLGFGMDAGARHPELTPADIVAGEWSCVEKQQLPG